jgi:hypothetical protein
MSAPNVQTYVEEAIVHKSDNIKVRQKNMGGSFL